MCTFNCFQIVSIGNWLFFPFVHANNCHKNGSRLFNLRMNVRWFRRLSFRLFEVHRNCVCPLHHWIHPKKIREKTQRTAKRNWAKTKNCTAKKWPQQNYRIKYTFVQKRTLRIISSGVICVFAVCSPLSRRIHCKKGQTELFYRFVLLHCFKIFTTQYPT